MENTEEKEVRVIAIKLPFDLNERILSFPFLHAVSEYYPKADIHLITPKKEVEVLNLLPFKAYYHLFNEDDIKTILDVHPYTANASIYNVDIFVSLTNSFPDACLGLGLRAKKRVGFSDDWKTIVLTHKVKRPIGHHVVEDYMCLLDLMTGKPHDNKLKVHARPLLPMLEDKSPYIAINLSPLRGIDIEDEWIELISHFEGKKIVLFASEDQDKVKILMENFVKRLSPKNVYEVFYYKDWIELGRMLSFSNGVITYSGACAALSAYVGTNTLILFDNEDPQRSGPFYFLSEVSIMGVNNPNLVNSSAVKTIKDRTTFNMTEVYIKAMEFFKI